MESKPGSVTPADGLTPEEEAIVAEMERHHAEMQKGESPEGGGGSAKEPSESNTEQASSEEAKPILSPETIEVIGAALNAFLADVMACMKNQMSPMADKPGKVADR
jgi:hypothetical protein